MNNISDAAMFTGAIDAYGTLLLTICDGTQRVLTLDTSGIDLTHEAYVPSSNNTMPVVQRWMYTPAQTVSDDRLYFTLRS